MKKITWLVLFALMLTGCASVSSSGSAVLVKTISLSSSKTEEVKYADLENKKSIRATYQKTGDTDYSFSQDVVLDEVYVSMGDEVTAGQILASSRDYTESKEEADALSDDIALLEEKKEDLEKQIDFETRRAEINYKYGLITQDEYSKQLNNISLNYKLELAEFEDTLYLDRLKLADLQDLMSISAIYATEDGTVTYTLNVADTSGYDEFVGGRINAVTAGTTVVATSNMSECAFVSRTEYTDLVEVGQTVELVCDSGEMIVTVVSSIEDGVINFIPEDESLVINISTSASYEVVENSREHVLSVSYNNIHEGQDGYYVYVIDSEGHRSVRDIEVGLICSDKVEIVSGLSEGELIVVR